MTTIKVAATQMPCSSKIEQNLLTAETLVREAAAKGAQIIVLQELFESLYFCQVENPDFFSLATTVEENPAVTRFAEIAAQLKVVLPISFFEKKGQAYFNSLAVIDADGALLGVYRKTHIPDGPGYEEKFYFSPGDTGFKVWKTRYATIGVGICWDQWFPEAARAMALMGAEILLYPTAIGSEPLNPSYDSQPHWQTCMQGHAAANLTCRTFFSW
jgi:N-carbamoylputrescine amidase